MRRIRKRLLIMIVALAAVIAAAVVGVVYYIAGMQTALWNRAVEEIVEVTVQGSHAFEIYTQKDMQILTRIEKHLAEESVIAADADEKIPKLIQLFEEDDVEFTVVDLDDGIMYSKRENESLMLDESEMSVYESLTGRGFREPYIDEYTGRSVIGGYARINFLDGEGLVQVKRTVSAVANEFVLTFYNETGFSYIANSKGDILIRSEHKNSNRSFMNLLDVVRVSGNDEKDAETLKSCLGEGKRGAMRLSFDGEENIVAFTPVSGTDGWMLVAVVPNDVIMSHADKILKSQQTMAILIVAVVVIAALFITIEQVSYRKIRQKESDVLYREQLFDILANNTNDVFIMLSTDNYKVEYISPNVERVLGIAQKSILEDIHVLQAPFDAPLSDPDIAETLNRDGSVVFTNERRHGKTGEMRYFRETVYKTRLQSSQRYVAVLSDRTQERQSEQTLINALDIAKSANESKSNFLFNMSHDIRTPMNAIIGFSTLIAKDANKPDKVREYVKKISVSSQHLLSLINDILDMSKIESGKTALHIEEFSPKEFFEEIDSMITPSAKAKKQKFEISIDGDMPEAVIGDKLRFNQIVLNLLSNAIKYTPEKGNIQLRVNALQNKIPNHVHFTIEVRDNGVGMAKDFVNHIFEPFVREDNRFAQSVQGSGLGMAITKNIIDLMGGTISVESEAGVGSTFTVELELPLGGNARMLSESASENTESDFAPETLDVSDVLAGKHILLTEDNEINVEILSDLLDAEGATCDVAHNGKEALEIFEAAEKNKYDLVFMDIQMPVMNGYEATRAIRACSHPQAKTVPIIAMTANAFDDDVKRSLDSGMNAHLAKPIDMDKVKAVVAKILGKTRK